ncbi:MAG: hypothetical protein ACREUY_10690 [Burkholderiales bacterium]
MAGQLLLVNPKRRHKAVKRSRKSTSRRRRNPMQFVNPAPRRRRRARSHALPRRSRSRRYANPIRRHRRRRNPSMRGVGGFAMGSAVDAVQGAAGAIAVDAVWGFLPLPANIKTGPIGTLAKAGGTIALGMLASNMIGAGIAKRVTTGALTVQIYNYLKPMLAGVIPGLGYYGAGYALNGMGRYISETPSSLDAFVPNSLNDYSDIDTSNIPGMSMEEYIH